MVADDPNTVQKECGPVNPRIFVLRRVPGIVDMSYLLIRNTFINYADITQIDSIDGRRS